MSESTSPDKCGASLLANLRNFRFQKKVLSKINTVITLSSDDDSSQDISIIDVKGENTDSNEGGNVNIPITKVDSTPKEENCVANNTSDPITVIHVKDDSNNLKEDKTEMESAKSEAPVKEDVIEEEKKPVNFNAEGLKGLIQYYRALDPKMIEMNLIKAKGDCVKAKQLIREQMYGGGTVILGPSKPLKTIALPTKPVLTNQTVPTSNEGSVTTKNRSVDIIEKAKAQIESLSNRKVSEVKSAQKRSMTSKKKNGSTKKFKRIKRASTDDDYSGSDSDADAGGADGYAKEHLLIDSDDDSDVEITDATSREQQLVLEFLLNGKLSELLCMPKISKKKAEAIIEKRPFSGWRDMVEKFQATKGLGTEILNSASQFLYTRQVVTQLMNKCTRISAELEQANLAGNCAITEKPSLLSPDLTLAGYQMIGLNWLVMLRSKELNGILADEMGLGKTVQIIAFLARLKEKADPTAHHNPNLIVVPASTLDNWNNELARWCPSLRVSVYYGSIPERKSMRIKYVEDRARGYDVVLTTYALMTASKEERKMFRVLEFEYVIYDEAHKLKNMKTQLFETLSQVNAKRRILLTGTPLQNNLLELMSLLTFVMPDMFANKTEYLKCLFAGTSLKDESQSNNSSESNASLPRFEQEQIAQAKKIMKPFVLRRLKKDVLKDLPKKTDLVRSCDMVNRQRLIYDSFISTYSKSSEVKSEDSASGATMMMQLRKAANHPLLIRDIYTKFEISAIAKLLVKEPTYKEKNVDYVIEDLSTLSDFELHQISESYKSLKEFQLSDSMILDSGKFKAFDEMIPKLVQEGHRLLIFSQFVTMLNLIERYFHIRGHAFLRLDGNTPVPIRQNLIDQFNQDPTILAFLLSTRAGGLGINLTTADTVIIHDMDFNPYNDKQAEDRCHRVGQTRPVTVHRFVSTNSIEEGILQIALAKLNLEKEISTEDNMETIESETRQVLKKALGLESNLTTKKS